MASVERIPAFPVGDDAWRPRIATLTLARLTRAQVATAQACIKDHGADRPNAGADAIWHAATCLGEVPAPGRELALLQQLARNHADDARVPDALVTMALRYEQIDRRLPAAEALETLVDRYPKDPRARAAGQRAVCLYRTLKADSDAKRLLAQLERLYGRRGFRRPADADLVLLCQE